MSIYLDNAASTPIFPELLDLLNELNRKFYANPSSLHSLGRKSKKELDKAREFLAQSINCNKEELIFMSSATEANNFVFKTLDYELIITSPSEHPCVLEPAKAAAVPIIWLRLDLEGFINLGELEERLEEFKNKKILLSIMHGNNEIGTVQNLKAIGELKKKYPKLIFHSDCVQTYTKLPINIKDFSLDCMSCSAHKLHGPKGAGLLYLKQDLLKEIKLRKRPLLIGGGQEGDLRSGTENLISIIAFAEAVKINLENQELKKIFFENWLYFFNELKKIPGAIINGPKDTAKRVPGNINISFTNSSLNSEELVLQLDLAGLAISSGSACSSNKNVQNAEILSSYVLRACKIDDEIAKKAVRISLSSLNSRQEIEDALKIINNILNKFNRSS